MAEDTESITQTQTPDDDSGQEPKSSTEPSAGPPFSVRIRTKSNEEIIREELRATGQSYLNVWRTGVALLPSILLAIAFLRREVFEQMYSSDSSLTSIPLDRYLLGTLFLFLVAYIFFKLCVDLAARWRWYSEQLANECDNALGLPPLTEGQRQHSFFRRVFFVFPAFDLFVRAVVETEKVGFHLEYFTIAAVLGIVFWLNNRSVVAK